MNESNPDNTEFVLPIVCPHCSKELNLAMIFALLAPDADVASDTEVSKPGSNNVTEEEA